MTTLARPIVRVVPLAALLLLACGDDSGQMTGETSTAATTTTTTSAATDSATSTTGGTTQGETTGGTATEGTTGDTGCSFLDCTTSTSGDTKQCSVWEQDCPRGEKCMPWANDGGSWNATKCSPLDPNPGQDGDKCTVTDSAVSGIDSCDLGLLCWFVDNETGEGTCIPMCENESSPTCPAGKTCDISNEGVLILCLEACDPVVVDCPEGQICFPAATEGFICDFDASGDAGAYGDPCEFINVCDPGLFCADPTDVPGCNAGGCCSEFCDINLPNTCSGMGGGQECIPWYEDGEAPPGLGHVGACAIPG